MKLILYFGHTGTAQKASELLKEYWSDSIVLDGTKKLIKDFSNIDSIIMGSNIHMGKLHKGFIKRAKKLQKKYSDLPIHAFIVSANANEKGKYMNLARAILPENAYVGYFGGELDPSRAKGITKLVIQNCIAKLNEQDLDLPTLDKEAIEDFIVHIQSESI